MGTYRPRRSALWAAPVAALVVLIALGGLLVLRGDPDGMDDDALSGPDRPRAQVQPRTGVFLGADPGEVAPYEAWLGRPVDDVVQFADRRTWADIAAPDDLLREWRGTRHRMVFSLPMLPEAGPATVAKGATGAYNDYFRTLATAFVAAGMTDTIFRVGWEFNLEGSRWSSDDPSTFVAYWRQIVTAMRSVPGQHFIFDWNPNNGDTRYDATRYYPGDDVVDIVGVDAYDNSWARHTYPYPRDCDQACRLDRQRTAWTKAVYGGHRGLRFWSRFARHHGKPMSLPEWGLWDRLDHHGGGDDVHYLQQMRAFIADEANDVAYHAYFEFDAPDGRHRLMTTFPVAGEYYRRAFG